MTNEVVIGSWYRHDSGVVMRVVEASVPLAENYVILSDSEEDEVANGFEKTWRGNWEEFFKQWTKL